MTIAISTGRWSYVGNGVTTVFVYTAKIFSSSDLRVEVNDVLQVAGYTVSGVGSDAGGNVTFAVAPANLAKIVITIAPPVTHDLDLTGLGDFSPQAVEDQFDKNINIMKMLAEKVARAAKVPGSANLVDFPFPDPALNPSLYLRAKSDGMGFELVALTLVGTYVNPITTLGDLLRGGTAGVAERLGVGANGQALVVDPASGKPEWRDGSPLALVNRTGVTLAVGDVVGLDTANDASAVLADTSASLKTFAISLGTPANLATGLFMRSGLAPVVKAQGAIARGQYVRKSATTRAVEDAGVTMTDANAPPAGTIGVAVTAAAGGFVSIVKFPATGSGAAAAGAPAGAQYLTLALDATLTGERVFVAGAGLGLTDGGANNNATLAAASYVYDRVTADTNVNNTGVETTIYTKSITGGDLGTTKRLRLTLQLKVQDTSALLALPPGSFVTFRLKYGATTIATAKLVTSSGDGVTNFAGTPANTGYLLECVLSADGATNAQTGHIGIQGPIQIAANNTATIGVAVAGVLWNDSTARGTGAVDSTANQILAVTAQWNTAAASKLLTMEHAVLELR